MRKSEVAQLLAVMSAFDKRTVGPLDVEAWSELDVCRRFDFATCREAVVRFFDKLPSERGVSPYLDPHQFAASVREVRREQRRQVDRLRSLVLGTVTQAMVEAGRSYEDITAARTEITRDEERMFEEGHSPAEVSAYLDETARRWTRTGLTAGEETGGRA